MAEHAETEHPETDPETDARPAHHRESDEARVERLRRERYDLFDMLIDSSRDGDLSEEAAIAIYRDLKPVAVQEVIPGTPHLHELDASTGEEWCIDCGTVARHCEAEHQ